MAEKFTKQLEDYINDTKVKYDTLHSELENLEHTKGTIQVQINATKKEIRKHIAVKRSFEKKINKHTKSKKIIDAFHEYGVYVASNQLVDIMDHRRPINEYQKDMFPGIERHAGKTTFKVLNTAGKYDKYTIETTMIDYELVVVDGMLRLAEPTTDVERQVYNCLIGMKATYCFRDEEIICEIDKMTTTNAAHMRFLQRLLLNNKRDSFVTLPSISEHIFWEIKTKDALHFFVSLQLCKFTPIGKKNVATAA